jgi:hypothetical protein
LLARALEVVGDDSATRSRILARLAVDLSLDDPLAAERTADEAVALARESNDRTALLESLMRRASFLLTPHSLTARRLALREILELSSRSTDVVTRYFALSASVVAAIQASDLVEAENSSTEADAIAVHYDLSPLEWSVRARRAWRAGLAGRLDEAEQLILDAWNYGNEHGVSHAAEAAQLQRVTLRWQQNRLGEVLPVARAAHDDYSSRSPGITIVLVRALAEHATGHDEARALLSNLAQDEFARLPMGTFWSTALVVAAEAACMTGLPDVSSTIRDLLLPFVDQVAFTGLWVTAPIAYGVAVACAGCDDRRAPKFFRHAAEIAERIHAPVLAARALEYPHGNRR